MSPEALTRDYRRRLYGRWFVGFGDTSGSLAFLNTASSERRNLRSITLGGRALGEVASLASRPGAHGFPLFIVDLVMECSSVFGFPQSQKWQRAWSTGVQCDFERAKPVSLQGYEAS